jgi:hypothetical protein
LAERETALHRSRQAELSAKTQVLQQQLAQRQSERPSFNPRGALAEQLVLLTANLRLRHRW